MKKLIRQARLPKGAYTKDLAEVLSPYAKKAIIEGKRKKHEQSNS